MVRDREKPLQVDWVRERLARSLFLGPLVYRPSVDSTNTLAREMAAAGAPQGTLVLAEEQWAGKGRRGRKWLSPPYTNLYLSLLLRPQMEAEEVFILTVILALAVLESVERVSELRPAIKWPNDIYAKGKKMAGILTEFSTTGKRVEYVILGLGINVNWKPEEDRSMLYPVTSISAETQRAVSREEVLVYLLKAFGRDYGEVLAGRRRAFYEKWNERSFFLGQRVRLKGPKGEISGRALRVDERGALIIRDEKGEEQRILSGDVSVEEIGDQGLEKGPFSEESGVRKGENGHGNNSAEG